MKPYMHFKVIKAFMDNIHKESLMQSNLVNDGEELHFDTLWYLDENNTAIERVVPENMRDVVLATKGNNKYIIPLSMLEKLPFKVVDFVPCCLKKSDKKVWKLVTDIETILLPANNEVNVRKFVDNWNTIEHSNQMTWTFHKLVALSTQHMGIKLCVCSEVASGKNSNAVLITEIKRNWLITSTPTIAKAETSLYHNEVIYFNEMGKPKTEELHAIQDFFIFLADQSVRYNKRSLAIKRGMEVIDITKRSIIHTYNRKQDLLKGHLIWDEIFPNQSALRNRYPQFLVEGHVTEQISDLSDSKIKEILISYDLDIKNTISNFMGLSKAVSKQIHNYSTDLLMKKSKSCEWGFTPRQLTNVQGLLEFIDAYCLNQDEFNEWLLYLNNAKLSYDKMLSVSSEVEQPSISFEKFNKIEKEMI